MLNVKGLLLIMVLVGLLSALMYNLWTKKKGKKSTNDHDSEGQTLQSISGEDVNDTKLDLIRAYIDMDESDNAMTLLKEVLHQGNVAQKDEARTLLTELK